MYYSKFFKDKLNNRIKKYIINWETDKALVIYINTLIFYILMKEEKQINLRIKDENQFYSNETTINFGPIEFVLDFRCATHIQDIPNHKAILLNHNVIILTPYHAKSFLNVLNKAVKDYEDKFGIIKKPNEVKKAEKLFDKEKKKLEVKEEDKNEAYFG